MEVGTKMHKTIYKYSIVASIFVFSLLSFSSFVFADNYGERPYGDYEYSSSSPSSVTGSTQAYRDKFLADQQALATAQEGDTIVNPPTVTTTPLNLTRTLKYKMSGDDVKELQSYLNIHIYTNLTTDGKFGPLTKQAVIKFQQTNKLTPDGIVGPLTRGKMK